jgi:hypothetical protein
VYIADEEDGDTDMGQFWKPSAAERRAIRVYAAKSENLAPKQIILDVGQRYSLKDGTQSFNVLLVDSTPDWEESDLHDLCSFTSLNKVRLNADGCAVVDFYVYRNNRDSELLTNVQAHVEHVDGKPHIVRLTGTGSKTISGKSVVEALAAS